MRDLFDGVPNLANKRQPVRAVDADALLPMLREQRESLLRRIKPRQAGVTELRVRLKTITHLIMRLEMAG